VLRSTNTIWHYLLVVEEAGTSVECERWKQHPVYSGMHVTCVFVHVRVHLATFLNMIYTTTSILVALAVYVGAVTKVSHITFGAEPMRSCELCSYSRKEQLKKKNFLAY
jgi:hypothetical protein